MSGTLVVVGTGIKAVGHLTADARAWIQRADKVLHVAVDPLIEREIRTLNPAAESLRSLYQPDRRRVVTYEAMVERIIGELAPDRIVCAVFYGHPGVFVKPSHAAITRARDAGHVAMMLPGISAEDCLVADLGVDPAEIGFQTYEATDFLIHPRQVDPCSGLVLWQIGAIGNLGAPRPGFERLGIELLVSVLSSAYGGGHEVIVYEAASLPTCDPVVHRVPLSGLATAPISALSTLFVPPLRRPSLDLERVRALGLDPASFGHA